MDKFVGTVLDNRYEILEVIGTGGMAMVYKARDNRLNRLVAIKILKEDLALDSDFRRRFQTESQAVAMLSSPNIVAVYDVSKSLDLEYIVMELIEGITLKQYMNRKGRLNWKESLHFATQITKALSHAHSRGIIHRDIKPHNIMILKDGSVKVADFGIARLQDNKVSTLTQEALGSVHYISPEQAKGASVDVRSDLYSVGVVLYEMLSSRLPFEGESAVSVAIQHISSIPLSPREINPDIPAGLEAITMKAMNPSLSMRYQTADEMLRDFEEFRKNPSVIFPYGAYAAAGAQVSEPPPVMPQNRVPNRPVQQMERREMRPNQNRDLDHRPSKRSAEEMDKDTYRHRNKKARKVSTLLGFGIVAVVLIAIFGFMWPFINNIIGNDSSDRHEITNFVGRHIDVVQDNDDYWELYRFTVEFEQTDERPEGFILRQTPVAGRPVLPESHGRISVTLTVAASLDEVLMPDLVNLSFEQAQITLSNLGIPISLIERHEQPSDSIMENHVIDTIPRPGAQIPDGGEIHIFVSTGPTAQEVTVPDLRGMSLNVAINTLQDLGLDFSQVNEYNAAANGTVISQSIAHGSRVEVGTVQIVLTVSLGPEPTPEPTPTPSPSPSPSPTPSPPPSPDPGYGDEEDE